MPDFCCKYLVSSRCFGCLIGGASIWYPLQFSLPHVRHRSFIYFHACKAYPVIWCIFYFICGSNSVTAHSHSTLRSQAYDDAHYEALLKEYIKFLMASDGNFVTLSIWHPRLICGQVQDLYPTLSPLLMVVFKAPALTSATERKHKTYKRVSTS